MPRGKPNKRLNAPKQSQADGQGVNKLEAVREALAALGTDTKPLQIKEYIKAKSSLDLDLKLVSTYKFTAAKQLARRGGVASAPTEPGTPKAATGGITVEDVQEVKQVLDRVGAEKVRALTGVLTK